MTSALADDTLLFLKRREGRRFTGCSLQHEESLQHILCSVSIKQGEMMCLTFFFQTPPPTQTQTCARNPKRKPQLQLKKHAVTSVPDGPSFAAALSPGLLLPLP